MATEAAAVAAAAATGAGAAGGAAAGCGVPAAAAAPVAAPVAARWGPPRSLVVGMGGEGARDGGRLAGKVAVISGASRGFGQAIAVRFVEEGARVALLSRTAPTDTLALIASIPGLAVAVDAVAVWVKADISSEEECQAAIAGTVAAFGDVIHVLINNAALFVFHSVEHATAADWDASAAVNIKGAALLTKAALPYMKRAGGASIVWQGSISSFLAQPDCATYAAMKGAVVQLARNCAYDFAKYKIRSNSVCAGTIETPISVEERTAHDWTYEEWEKLKTKDVILGRGTAPSSRFRVLP